MANQEKEKVIEKIKKLLRLAKSTNEHEAALAAARAQELLAKYNLEGLDLSEREIPQEAETAYTSTLKKPSAWVFNLAASVAGAFDCQYFHCSSGHTFFVGVGADHEVANFTFGYLYRSINRLAAAFMGKSQQKRLTAKGKIKVRQSYCLGAVQVVSLKLAQQKAVTPITTTALVPVKEALICRKMDSYNVKTKEAVEVDISDRAFWQGRRDGEGLAHRRRGMPGTKGKQLRLGR